jgi:uncharacterized membrane-anchored protein
MKLDQAVRAAINAGVLPSGAAPSKHDARPWPVVLLTGLGAWLAALPLLGMVGLLLGDLLQRSAGPYIVAALVLAGAVVVLRSRDLPLFVEQLAVPALLVGGGSLGFGVFRDLPDEAASAVLAGVALCFAAVIARGWLRVLLGALAAVLAALAVPLDAWGAWGAWGRWSSVSHGLAWHTVFGAWLAAVWVQRRALFDRARLHWAAALDPVLAGWLLATLAGLAWWSGMTFLVGASVGEVRGVGAGDPAASWFKAMHPGLQALSVGLAVAGAALAARAWPSLRQPWCGCVAAVLAALAWFMPALGAVLLALGVAATTHRWLLAGAAALAAAWIAGAFYYQLAWGLATKAVVLTAAGAAIGALAWWALRHQHAPAGATSQNAPAPSVPMLRPHVSQALIGLGVLAVLGVANTAIVQKERLIARGQPVFVELAPVDPRSLMQGDYMALNFRIPSDAMPAPERRLGVRRPQVVARRDARGVAVITRADDGQPLAAGEIRIELTPKSGRWMLVSDAWFFREGDAQRWAAARYGEFRVVDSGQALLVGLADEALQPIRP